MKSWYFEWIGVVGMWFDGPVIIFLEDILQQLYAAIMGRESRDLVWNCDP